MPGPIASVVPRRTIGFSFNLFTEGTNAKLFRTVFSNFSFSAPFSCIAPYTSTASFGSTVPFSTTARFGSSAPSPSFRNVNDNARKMLNQHTTINFVHRKFSVSKPLEGSAARAETTSTTQGLSKLQAQELVLRLTDDERNVLVTALNEIRSKETKDNYQDELVIRPTTKELVDISVANSIPFIGFGFLDNFFMLLFGDYIDVYMGSYFFMSTMTAAALGNTFSDVLGIGTAFYVERLANKIGFKPPKLTPAQLDMPISRNFANLGRVLGVTLGCLLGMVPLLFFNRDGKDKDEKETPEGTEKIKKKADGKGT